MSRPRPSRGGAARRRAGWVSAALLVAGAIWAGCTVTPENYETLSFWFDGVPPPWTPDMGGQNIRASATYTAHEPWLGQQCYDCHQGRFDTTAVDSSVCLQCHEEVTTAQPLMHGPVVAVACLWCHAPHESPYAALMKGKARDVCSNCHAPGMLGAETTPEHAPDSEVSCLECHYGHGGTTRHFLRPEGGSMAPPQRNRTSGSEPTEAAPPAEGGTAP